MPIYPYGNQGGSSPIIQATIPVSKLALTRLNSFPLILVAPQGPKKIIRLINATQQYKGTLYFPAGIAQPYIGCSNSTANSQAIFDGLPVNSLTTLLGTIALNNQDLDIFNNVGLPLFYTSSADAGFWGPIDSITITAGNAGTGYALNDTGIITTDSGDATYIVTGIGALGVVTGINMTNPGTSYTNAIGNATATGGAQPGVGVGLQLDTTVLATSTGTAQIDVWYSVINAIP